MHGRLTKLIHLCYYVLIFITPLLMSNQTSEMFEFPKILIIYVIAFTVFALWLIDFIIHRRSVRIPSLVVVVGVFLASQMLATATSVDIHTSIFGYYGRFNGGLLSIIAYCILFFVALQTFDRKTFYTLLKVSLAASMVVLLWGLPGRLLGVDMSCILYRGEFSTACWTNEFRPQERMFSTLGQPNWLGVYLTMHVFMGLFLWIRKTQVTFRDMIKPTKRTILYGIYTLLVAFGVVLTGSRSSEMGLFGGLVALILIYLWKRGKKAHVKILAILIILNVIVFGAWYAYRLSDSKTDKITHSGTIRLIVWEGALKLASRYPLTGTGPETFAYTYFLTRPEAHNNTTERDLIYNKAHNEFLNFLATTGLIGFSAYIFMLFMMIRPLLQSKEGSILAGGIIAMSIANFFGFSTSTGQMLLFLIPLYGLLQKDILPVTHTHKSHVWVKNILVALVFGGWALTMRYFYNYYQADLSYAKATSLQYASSYIESIDAFTKALGYRFEHIYADKFALTVAQTAYVLSEADTEKIYGSQIQSYIKMAESIQTAALQSSPQNPMYWKDRVRMYLLIQDVVNAKDKKDIQLQIKTAIARATQLAPTDLEVREMIKSSN
jgi:O-antigen ligase